MDNRGMITFSDLDAALSVCMLQHPPAGQELALHPDASRMAGLWAEMLLSGDKSREWQSADARVFAAYQVWAVAQCT